MDLECGLVIAYLLSMGDIPGIDPQHQTHKTTVIITINQCEAGAMGLIGQVPVITQHGDSSLDPQNL